MIQKTVSFTTADGQLHATVELAQAHELNAFLTEHKIQGKDDASESLGVILLRHKDHIVDLLTMKASSRPKARKANGAIRKRAVKADTQQPALKV